MPELSWRAAADGRYWIDVAIGGRPVRVMIDLGLVDPSNRVGFELEPAFYDELKRSGLLSRFQFRYRRDANGEITQSESGLAAVQLMEPQTMQILAPVLQLHVCRGVAGIPSRVGVVFFHRLADCSVHWNLGTQTWTIHRP
jgi:hypothetical protein